MCYSWTVFSLFKPFINIGTYSVTEQCTSTFYTPPLFIAPIKGDPEPLIRNGSGWPRRNFVKMFDADKTRLIPYGEKSMTICQAVFIWYRNVTDRRTDRRTDGQTDIIAISISRVSVLLTRKRKSVQRTKEMLYPHRNWSNWRSIFEVKVQGHWGQEKGRPHTASASGAELILNILLATLNYCSYWDCAAVTRDKNHRIFMKLYTQQ